jgi:hypothetical protein
MPRKSYSLPCPRIQLVMESVSTKTPSNLSSQFAASADPGFEFGKSNQLLLSTHNETLSVVAVCVYNEDRSPVGIKR